MKVLQSALPGLTLIPLIIYYKIYMFKLLYVW